MSVPIACGPRYQPSNGGISQIASLVNRSTKQGFLHQVLGIVQRSGQLSSANSRASTLTPAELTQLGLRCP